MGTATAMLPSAAELRGASGGSAVHVQHVPARPAALASWPEFVPTELRTALAARGVEAPWSHQSEAAALAWAGASVVIATGTASGKSLAYLLPTLSAAHQRGATALYLSPTKALAADQLASVRGLALPGVRAAAYDGDTPLEERDWARRHGHIVLTNPDMLHRSMLPGHARWASFWKRLSYVVVDECHHYRGVFGSHVALVLRRLRRIAAQYGASPVFILASATVSDPGVAARRLTGLEVVPVTDDGSPRGSLDVVMWEPGPLDPAVPDGPRRSASAEAAALLAELVGSGQQVLAFVPSRRGAESVAEQARRLLGHDPGLANRVAAYRGGYLPEERRALELALRERSLVGLATTNALELGIDVAGLDAVVLAGYPGRVASFWQQIGRAGRRGGDALAVLVARDDPLDTYLLRHPSALFDRPAEATVLDPDNPYVLRPHIAAAAAEGPLTVADLDLFGTGAPAATESLTEQGVLRKRPTGWFWTRRGRAADLVDLRGGGSPVAVVEAATGRLLGTVDEGAADATVHVGAIYVHQAATYAVTSYTPEEAVAEAERCAVDYSTWARRTTDVAVVDLLATQQAGPLGLHFGAVDVTTQVVGFLRRRLRTGEVLGESPLDLPRRALCTRAVWWTLGSDLLGAAGVPAAVVPGAAHAAEHAAIGLLPLVATCDRWDVRGLSTAWHPDTQAASVFVYDGAPGGAGFAERGFAAAGRWLTATRDAVAGCRCEDGCPSCVHSPKCGNGNAPLDKSAALALLTEITACLDRHVA